jgi:hypothetical protein
MTDHKMNQLLKLSSLVAGCLSLTACMGCYNPNGCNRDTSPYFYTTTTTQVRGLSVPTQSKLTYKQTRMNQKEQQDHLLDEKQLTEIQLPANTAMVWGGMPSVRFTRFFNSDMNGFTVSRAPNTKSAISTDFVKLWHACDSDLDVTLSNPNDWSFNPQNMEITGCGVNIQKRGPYNEHSPTQYQSDEFLQKINNAIQKLSKQHSYPVLQLPSGE